MYSDPQVAAELLDQQCSVPASSKRDVKADSMTPASLARGCLDPRAVSMSVAGEADKLWVTADPITPALPAVYESDTTRSRSFCQE